MLRRFIHDPSDPRFYDRRLFKGGGKGGSAPPPPKPAPKREDVATPENELDRQARRRGVGATILSDQSKLGESGKLGG